MMQPLTQLARDLMVLSGAVNTGVLRSGDKAVLFDCCDTVTPERLAAVGIRQVDLICCTHPLLPNVAGCGVWAARGAGMAVAASARQLLETPDRFWSKWNNRWDLYAYQPAPRVPATPLPVARALVDDETISWEGYRIKAVLLPGPMLGAMAFVVECDGTSYCFSGDVMYGPGQFWEFQLFQKLYVDFHGFGYFHEELEASLNRLLRCNASVMIPAHGEVMSAPGDAIRLTLARVERVWETVRLTAPVDIIFAGKWTGQPPLCTTIASEMETALPSFVRHVAPTTKLIVSESGDALVVDVADDVAVNEILRQRANGDLVSVEGIYVTHYHDDHVGGIGALCLNFPACDVIADASMVDILRHPARYRLPCISHRPCPVTRPVPDGVTWSWREFTLSSYHFPSQTLYHGALLVEGRGLRLLFTGDGFMAGLFLNDYCTGNRNLLGAGRGYDACLSLLRRLHPDLLVAQHAERPFRWTVQQLDRMAAGLARRAALFADMLPWSNPNFGIDENWVRAYPYSQDIGIGATCRLDVVFANHGNSIAQAAVVPVLPAGWTFRHVDGTSTGSIPPGTEQARSLWITPPLDAKPGLYVIPLRITWDGRYLGQYRQALIEVFSM